MTRIFFSLMPAMDASARSLGGCPARCGGVLVVALRVLDPFLRRFHDQVEGELHGLGRMLGLVRDDAPAWRRDRLELPEELVLLHVLDEVRDGRERVRL